MSTYELEVSEPGQPSRLVGVSAELEVGRDPGMGLVLDDTEVSRAHLRFTVEDGELVVTDLGSTNGTTVNGSRVSRPTSLHAGDHVVAGATSISVKPGAAVPPRPPPPPLVPGVGAVPGASALPQRPALDLLSSMESDAAVVRFRPGTAGEKAAPGVLRAAARARKRLAGLGSEPWGRKPDICLVDPFATGGDSQAGAAAVMTSGTVVDAERNEIWMVVTAESPPEVLERPLALLWGAALPAGPEIKPLLEGYGLSLAGTNDPSERLAALDLPPLAKAEGQVAPAMALAFVRYLEESQGHASLIKFFSSAQPGRLDEAAQSCFGAGLATLEQRWRQKLAGRGQKVKTGQFLRLALRYLRPHRWREAEMAVYMLLGLAFTVTYPFAFRSLIDTAIPSGHFHQVLEILLVLFGAFIVSMLAGLRRAYLTAVVSGSVVRQVRQEMFDRLQLLPKAWYSGHEQGDVLSRLFSDVGTVQMGLSQTLRDGLFQMVTLLVSAITLLVLDPLLAVIVFVGAPAIAFVYKSMAAGAQKRSVAVQEETAGALSVAAENYGAQQVVKAFALAAREVTRFRQASGRLFDRQVKLSLFGGLFGLSVNMIVTVLQVVVLGFGSYLVLHGRLTLGGLVAFMSMMGQVISPVTTLAGIGQQVQAATGALVRVNEVLDADIENEQAEGATVVPPLSRSIVFRDVAFSYAAGQRTLEGLNIEIKAGQKVAFVGPTGAGKSSVLQLIMRFYDPDEGAVLFDGVDLKSATLASVRGQIGAVFQETFLFNATVRENIALGRPGSSAADVEAAARAAEMADFIESLPRGYDTLVGERGGRLSGGQAQRLSIARALLRDPKVLVLDEATSALDPRTERLISATLQKVGQGRTTIAVTHRLSSVTSYDQIVVVSEGKALEHGTHEQLLARGGLYAQLWSEQTGAAAPAEAPMDVEGALGRLPLFSGLPIDGLANVARATKPAELGAGTRLREGGGLYLVRRGRALVLAPALGTSLSPMAELSPGDAFGLSALLGDDVGRNLEAVGPVSLIVLDSDALAGLAAQYPTVAAALEGRAPGGPAAPVVPIGGTRLSRMTVALVAPMAPLAVPGDLAPSAEDVRRMTGTMKAVGQ